MNPPFAPTPLMMGTFVPWIIGDRNPRVTCDAEDFNSLSTRNRSEYGRAVPGPRIGAAAPADKAHDRGQVPV